MAGVAKGYTLTPDYVLYEMSHANTILYSSVLPSYDDIKEKDRINADDPKNRERVKKTLYELSDD